MDLAAAERCLHERAQQAFVAAANGGLPGKFEAFRRAGLFALLTTAPDLSFLNSVCGVTEDSLPRLPEVLQAFSAASAPAPSLVTEEPSAILQEQLACMGYVASGHRPIALIDLPAHRRPESVDRHRPPGRLQVTEVEAGDDQALFLAVLAAGYVATQCVSDFLLAEHSTLPLRRFLVWHGDEPIAAGAMSLHDSVAVLGGAATVPDARGRGAQAALLQHRLRLATEADCVAAVATAAQDSASARNLARAGFRVRLRRSWREQEAT